MQAMATEEIAAGQEGGAGGGPGDGPAPWWHLAQMLHQTDAKLSQRIDNQGQELRASIERVDAKVEQQGKDLRAAIEQQGKDLRAAIEQQGKDLRADIKATVGPLYGILWTIFALLLAAVLGGMIKVFFFK